MRLSVLACVVLTACGGASDASAPPATPETTQRPVPQEDPEPPPGSLWREDVTETVDQGLGYFLQRVELEAVVQGGQFEGFRIVSLYPSDYWDGVDLKPGDVITGVNGMPIERDIQAHAAFESLRQADAIRVQYRRGGEERELVYAIVERPGSRGKQPASEPAAGGTDAAEPPPDAAAPGSGGRQGAEPG